MEWDGYVWFKNHNIIQQGKMFRVAPKTYNGPIFFINSQFESYSSVHISLFQDSEETIHRAEQKWYLISKPRLFSLEKTKENQNGRQTNFPALPILNIFLQKCHGLCLRLVKLIGAKGIGATQPIWSWGCPTY